MNAAIRSQPQFTYSPYAVLNIQVLENHLFVRPSYGHYYFGDYYTPNYANLGFFPWFALQASRIGYDPLISKQRWQHRNDVNWEQQVKANFERLRQNEAARPPRTFAAQTAGTRQPDGQRIATDLRQLAQNQRERAQFKPVDAAEREQITQRKKDYMAYQQQRQSAERGARQIAQQQTSAAASTGIRRFSRSPLAAAEKPSDGKAPPPRPRQPNVDSTIAPRPRNRVSPALPSEAPAARRVGSRPNPSGQPRSSSPVPGSSPPPDGDKEKKQRPPSQQPRPQAS